MTEQTKDGVTARPRFNGAIALVLAADVAVIAALVWWLI
jgi:hypothetical protein